jgi:hypothetical protein
MLRLQGMFVERLITAGGSLIPAFTGRRVAEGEGQALRAQILVASPTNPITTVTKGKMKCHMVGSPPSVHSEKFIPPPNAINMSPKASAMAWMFFARIVICVSAFSYSICGPKTACWNGSTTRFVSSVANRGTGSQSERRA